MTDPLLPDLTPIAARPERRVRRVWSTLLVILVIAAVVAVLLRTLDDASLFFHPVDEAVELRAKLGEERFRVVGSPQPGVVETVTDGQAVTVFTLCVDDVFADVVHFGDPAELFRPGVPVVLQGSWRRGDPPSLDVLDQPAADGWYLRTDQMVVKHDNDYRAEGAELKSCGTAP